MRAEILDIKSDDSLEEYYDSYVKCGRPPTKVSFAVENEEVTLEFVGHSGMQLIGMASMVRSFAAEYSTDPMTIAVQIGLFARRLKAAQDCATEKESGDDLTIKFNGSKEKEE